MKFIDYTLREILLDIADEYCEDMGEMNDSLYFKEMIVEPKKRPGGTMWIEFLEYAMDIIKENLEQTNTKSISLTEIL